MSSNRNAVFHFKYQTSKQRGLYTSRREAKLAAPVILSSRALSSFDYNLFHGNSDQRTQSVDKFVYVLFIFVRRHWFPCWNMWYALHGWYDNWYGVDISTTSATNCLSFAIANVHCIAIYFPHCKPFHRLLTMIKHIVWNLTEIVIDFW